MGSLMAGWDSPVLGDDNKVRARRNKSLTKEEVEAFWKQHRIRLPDVDGDMSSSISPLGSPGGAGVPRSPHGSARGGVRVNNEPAARVEGFFPDDGAAAESPSKSRDWWTRSNWAFLNEPPQEEAAGKAQSYTPQFKVARIAAGGGDA